MTSPADLAPVRDHIKGERFGRAKRLLERALAGDPENCEIHSLLGDIELYRHRPGYALRFLEKSIAINKKQPEVWAKLGWCHYTAKSIEAAVAAYQAALKLDPKQYDALVGLGLCMLPLGEFKQMQGYLEAAIAISDQRLDVYRLLATYTPLGKDQKFLKKLITLAREKAAASADDQAQIQFALAKAYQQQGDKEAFLEHLKAANDLIFSAAGDWFPETKIIYDLSRQVLTREVLSGTPAGAQTITPIFIVGMPRSGSTLLEQILASHPKVFGADEIPLVEKIFVNDAMRDRQKIYPEFVPALGPGELAAMAEAYQSRLREISPDHTFFTDKMFGNAIYVGMIKKVLPWAKVIHIHRHPCDMAFSTYAQYFDSAAPFASNLEDLARRFRITQDFMTLWDKRIPGFVLDIKYEDLVGDLEAVTRKVLKFCGLKWDPACLDFHKTDRKVHTLSSGQVRQPLYNTSIGRWKEYEELLKPFIEGAGDGFEAYGYRWPEKN